MDGVGEPFTSLAYRRKDFQPSRLQYTYRTPNANQLLSIFHGDAELCPVAEDVRSEKIVGFIVRNNFETPVQIMGVRLSELDRSAQNVAKKWHWKKIVQRIGKAVQEQRSPISTVGVESDNPAGMPFPKSLDLTKPRRKYGVLKNLEQ